MNKEISQWLLWMQELQAISQTGLTYCKDPFCHERYQRLKVLAAEIGEKYTDVEVENIIELFTSQKDYPTPKIDVRAVVIEENKILMVQEADDQCWSLPGGWADVNTSPASSAVREVFEETGYEVDAKKLLAFYDKLQHAHPPQWPQAYKAFFLCELKGGEPKISHETLAIDFFAEDQLPELSVDRVLESQIHRMFEHYRQPNLPTDFD